MKTIINFYQSLDTFNLIIFWGLIIVLILLFIVLFITSNKKKKTKNNNFKQEEKFAEEKLPIKEIFPEQEIKQKIQEEKIELPPITNTKQPEKFIAEEHVMEYDKEIFSVPGLKKATEESPKPPIKEELTINNIPQSIPNKPYQRNVLREMSLNQTSPIGIVKTEDKETTITNKAQDLQKSLNMTLEEPTKKEDIPHIFNQHEEKPKINLPDSQNNNVSKIEKEPEPIKKEASQPHTSNLDNMTIKENYSSKTNNQVEKNASPKIPEKKEPTYLEEVSKKLSETISSNEIDRTEYELRQEEEAIISYEELMQKKDSLKMIDEEEAVISIEELMQKQNKEEKLYHLTEEEENDKFIDELKNFRKDL